MKNECENTSDPMSSRSVKMAYWARRVCVPYLFKALRGSRLINQPLRFLALGEGVDYSGTGIYMLIIRKKADSEKLYLYIGQSLATSERIKRRIDPDCRKKTPLHRPRFGTNGVKVCAFDSEASGKAITSWTTVELASFPNSNSERTTGLLTRKRPTCLPGNLSQCCSSPPPAADRT